MTYSGRKTMRTRLSIVIPLVTVFLLAGALPAAAQETIGVLHNSKGYVTVTREGKHLTRDLGGTASTVEFSDAVIASLA